MKRWEYKKEYDLKPNDLNELGLKGWELIGVNTHITVGSNVFYFKREIL